MSAIGETIKTARQQHGLSLRALGERVNLSASFLSEIERGTRRPTPETVRTICNEFPDEDSMEWLWTWLKDVVGFPTAVMMANYVLAVERNRQEQEGDGRC